MSAASGLLLAVDAAPGTGSAALLRGTQVVASGAVAMRAASRGAPDHDPLARLVEGVLREGGVRPHDLVGVACGAGPGGFTSLRIAAAFAKGLAHAAGIPLLAAPSLAWAAAARAPEAGTWIVTLDALRGERYAARVTLGDSPTIGVRAVEAYAYLGVHAADALAALAARHAARGTLDVVADVSVRPIALGALCLTPTPVDLAAWEPDYGRLAEAQARWEQVHGPLPTAPSVP